MLPAHAVNGHQRSLVGNDDIKHSERHPPQHSLHLQTKETINAVFQEHGKRHPDAHRARNQISIYSLKDNGVYHGKKIRDIHHFDYSDPYSQEKTRLWCIFKKKTFINTPTTDTSI